MGEAKALLVSGWVYIMHLTGNISVIAGQYALTLAFSSNLVCEYLEGWSEMC